MSKTKHLSAPAIAAAFIGTIVGAGFATGQEVLQFFTYYGRAGFIGILLATILFCYFGYVIMKISRDLKADSHLELVKFTAGKHLGFLLDWFITLSFLGVLVVMAAGSGAIAQEHFHLPPLYGSIAIILLSFITVISGVNNVIRAIGLVVPFLLLIVLGTAVFSIVHDPITINKITFIESLETPVTGNWFFSSVLYVSYNILLAVAILSPLGVESPGKKHLYFGAILGGFGLGFGIMAINLATLSGVPEILPFQVPMVFLAYRLNPVLAFIYGLILLLEIYTTAVSILYGFVARIAYKRRFRIFWAILASAGAIYASQLGFSKAITTVYPIMGLVGLFFLASIFLTVIRDPIILLFKRRYKRI